MVSVRREPRRRAREESAKRMRGGASPPATRRYLSGDLIACRWVLAKAQGMQDLMNDHEFRPSNATALLEVPSADENDAATRLGERGGIPPALGFSAAIHKPNELEKVICWIDSEPEEGRLEHIP